MAEKPTSNLRCLVCGAKSQSLNDPWRRTQALSIQPVTTAHAVKSRKWADAIRAANVRADGLRGGTGGRKV